MTTFVCHTNENVSNYTYLFDKQVQTEYMTTNAFNWHKIIESICYTSGK